MIINVNKLIAKGEFVRNKQKTITKKLDSEWRELYFFKLV